MAFVYWVHYPHHTDILQEGYIGITRNTPMARFKQHLKAAKLSKKKGKSLGRFKRVLLKNYTKLIVTTLLEGDYSYVLNVENKLRPSTNIGWNNHIGGAVNFELASVPTIDKKSTMEKYYSNNTHHMIGIKAWQTRNVLNSPVSVKAWSMADKVIAQLKDGKKEKDINMSLLGVARTSAVRSITSLYKSGWNPQEDKDWLIFSRGTNESSP